ncbi:UDP-glycosyltransferase 76B1-like [Magnolia sinica]|uniref:UDP-glycosyltransferase 76B1-like n=1 Tax=Magnolia sinica TaxID=86752 RepID=UPI00265AA60B|nr:UDP-glycosyltransferase 76B1-like [Magnolia sinica]
MTGVEGMQAQKDKGPHLVLFPIPFQGHLNPMLQLATLLHSKGFSITIIHTNFNAPNPSNYPSFNFEPIPDGLSDDRVAAMDPIALVAALNVVCKAPFEELLGRLVLENPYGPIKCIISDAMMHFTQEVAAHLDIPRIVIRTSSAISFAAFAAFPLLRQKGYLAVKDHQSKVPVPELPPLRCKDLPSNGFATSDPNALYHLMTHMVDGTRAASGVIWNAFDYLERSALMKIGQDFQIPNFSVGPLHKHASSSSCSLLPQDHSCIAWLDKQVHGSVLYVSFGSLAAMDESELVETAWGLADSNRHFLWVVRPGSVHGSDWVDLPKGFEEKTEGRCLVVKWAPQQEVLAHPAVGGFWTHGGWNSTLESICEGVPMICSPWFSDQRVNARYVDHVWRVGMQLDNGFERGEIEQAIRRLMVGNDGQEMRTRIKVLKENADGCLREGGSSYESLNSLKDYILSL